MFSDLCHMDKTNIEREQFYCTHSKNKQRKSANQIKAFIHFDTKMDMAMWSEKHSSFSTNFREYKYD